MKYRQPRYTVYTGKQTDISVTLWQNLPQNSTLFAGPDFSDKKIDDPVNDSRQTGMRLGISKTFAHGYSLFALAAVRRRDYERYSELLEAKRHDTEHTYIAVIQANRWSFKGLTPSLNLQYNRVKSNVDWLYSHERTSVSLKLERHF